MKKRKKVRKTDETLYIVSARKLEQKHIKEIREKFGKDLEVKTQIDESLLGGVLVKQGGKYFDGTVKGQVERLRDVLMQG